VSSATKSSPTSHDVARLAGVSQTTVSRVLRQDPTVGEATRQRVMQALAELRYQPNAAARAFRTRRADSIGVVVGRLSNQIYPAMLEMIGARLAGLGQRMIVWDSEYGGDTQASQALRQGIVDGIILTTITQDSPFIQEVCSAQAPVVLVNRTIDGYPSDQVSSDNSLGGSRVADYFVQCGRRRIAMISGPQLASTIRDREQGFRAALRRAGVDLPPHYYQQPAAFSHVSGCDAAMRLLELAAPPDAIFCANDVLALGALDGARRLGVRVPDDLWVVGYDDIEIASWDAYDLTTVRQPMEQMVARAIELLLARIKDASRPVDCECYASELVIRGSTGRQPCP
jgi:LacI family transcriptional regulator